MRTNSLFLLILSFAVAIPIAAQGPNLSYRSSYVDDLPSASSSTTKVSRLSVKPHHYLPSPAVGESYHETAATEIAIEKRLPRLSFARMSEPYTDTVYSRPHVIQAVYTTPAAMPAVETRMAAARTLRGHSTGDDLIDSFIVDSSQRYGIDPLLTFAQMGQESSYRARAVSPKGASGLMQLMPFTARRMGVANIYDPKQNIEGGVKYMRLLLDMFRNDLVLALAGYNAGEGAVIKYGYQVPPYKETIDYVHRISARYHAISGR
jgi:soluble lytic murein transglycosylase-like protein